MLKYLFNEILDQTKRQKIRSKIYHRFVSKFLQRKGNHPAYFQNLLTLKWGFICMKTHSSAGLWGSLEDFIEWKINHLDTNLWESHKLESFKSTNWLHHHKQKNKKKLVNLSTVWLHQLATPPTQQKEKKKRLSFSQFFDT